MNTKRLSSLWRLEGYRSPVLGSRNKNQIYVLFFYTKRKKKQLNFYSVTYACVISDKLVCLWVSLSVRFRVQEMRLTLAPFLDSFYLHWMLAFSLISKSN